MEYLIGNALGGLMMYSDSMWDPGTILNIDEIPYQKGGLRIYPNPAHDYFSCSLEDAEFVNPKAKVFNVLGEKVNVDVQQSFGKIVVSTTMLASGFYIVRVSDSGNYYTGKVLIEK